MKKNIIRGLALIIIIGLIVGVMLKPNIDRFLMVSSLFTGAEQYDNFPRSAELFPHSTMQAAANPQKFPQAARLQLPPRFSHQGQTYETQAFLETTDTAALLVLKNGEIIYENYWLTGGPNVNWLSMSVAKSFVSATLGIAVDEGFVKSIEQPITDYVPSLAGSAYDGVRIKDILQMSSGARWNEDYSDPDSDVMRFAEIFALGGSLNEFTATLQRQRPPGTFNQYNSADTQALAMLISQATGRSLTDYMTEKLWLPMGPENDAYWMLDAEGVEMAFGGLNATARDYAKLGELFRLKGRRDGRQIVPEAWVHASITPDAPHLMAGNNPNSDYPMGYGLQWWVPEGTEGEFSAIGVYNQFIFVNPTRDTVSVKLSANNAYATDEEIAGDSELATFSFFRAMNKSIQ
jgi:CubicO group peptidase (beta-lactamase class C family)